MIASRSDFIDHLLARVETSVKMLVEAIETFIASWNQHATPFEWTKEEVHQQQMKHSYSNRSSTVSGILF